MASKLQVANVFAERLLVADDKRQAARSILRRMDRLKHRKSSMLISRAEKQEIIELIQTRVNGELKTKGVDVDPYSTTVAYMLSHVSIRRKI